MRASGRVGGQAGTEESHTRLEEFAAAEAYRVHLAQHAQLENVAARPKKSIRDAERSQGKVVSDSPSSPENARGIVAETGNRIGVENTHTNVTVEPGMKLHDDDQQQLAPQEENLEDSDHERRKADADAMTAKIDANLCRRWSRGTSNGD